MTSEETSIDNRLSADQEVPAGVAPAPNTGGMAASRSLAGPLVMSGAGLLAGLAGWLILETAFPFFRVPDEVIQRLPLSFPSADALAEFRAEKQVVDLKNATVTGLLLGALVAGAFGLAKVAVRGFRRSFLPLACCIACGSVAGAAGGLVAQVWLHRSLATTEPMTAAVIFQAVFWAVLGAGTGLGMGWFSGSASRLGGLLCQGLLAGAVFGLLYAAGAAYAFPVDDAERLVPASPINRIVWAAIGPGLIGLLLGTASDRRRRPKAS